MVTITWYVENESVKLTGTDAEVDHDFGAERAKITKHVRGLMRATHVATLARLVERGGCDHRYAIYAVSDVREVDRTPEEIAADRDAAAIRAHRRAEEEEDDDR